MGPSQQGGFRPEADAAIKAVQRGLGLAFTRVGADDITSKGGRDLFTAADVAVEKAIRACLGDAFGFPVIGEEGGGQAEPGAPYWLVDPICGTRNFASGIPLFAVNVALVEDGHVTVGAVGDGATGEVHVAVRGGGAFARTEGDWRPISTSVESKTVVIDGWPRASEERVRMARFVAAAIGADKWDVRALGTTLSLAHLAAGRVAAYVLFEIPALHVAAGVALALEAGATVTDLAGLPWTVGSRSVIAAADQELHRELSEIATGTLSPSSVR